MKQLMAIKAKEKMKKIVEKPKEMTLLQQCQQELEMFKSEPEEHENINVLLWWKQNNHKFPILAKLAKMWLAIPATSASSERIFSIAGRVITKEKNRLNPKKASTIIFLNHLLNKELKRKKVEDIQAKKKKKKNKDCFRLQQRCKKKKTNDWKNDKTGKKCMFVVGVR